MIIQNHPFDHTTEISAAGGWKYVLFLLLGMSIVFTWLYNGTKGSVFLAILMHGAFNTFAAFFFPIQAGEFYDRLWWFMVVLWWVAAFAIIFSTAVNRDRRPAAARIQEIP